MGELVTTYLLFAVPEERMFALDPQMFINAGVQFLNVSVLAAVLYFLLYKPVRNFLRKREERIKSQIDQAKLDMTTANALRSQYEKSVESVSQERSEILEAAHKSALEKSRGILQAGKQEAASIRDRALTDIEREREKAEEALKLYIIDLATAMAEKIVAHSIDRETQERLFRETLMELEDVTWPK